MLINGEPMNGVPAYRRPVNMVFQHYALFPHFDVEQNVSYGLRQSAPQDQCQARFPRRANEALEMVRLGGFGKRRIHEMSGGQQQRVALARAIVNKPSVLLLDEPLAALDKKLRTAMQIELQTLQRELGITFVLVTHDQEEALSMSDLVCVMNAGRIVQLAAPQEVYDTQRTSSSPISLARPIALPQPSKQMVPHCALPMAARCRYLADRLSNLAPQSCAPPGSNQSASANGRRPASFPAPSPTASSSAHPPNIPSRSTGSAISRHRRPERPRRRRACRTGERVVLNFDPSAAHIFPAVNTTKKREHVMTKSYKENAPISVEQLTDELMRLKRGSVTRRHFLGVTGLGLATAVLARETGLFSTPAYAEDLGTQMSIATWPNYHDPATFEAFTAKTGVAVEVNVFGSNEEMLAKLQAGGTGWDLFVPTNYTISTYVKARPDRPARSGKAAELQRLDGNARFTDEGVVDGKTYAVPKNWGTTGIALNTTKIKTPVTSWKDFFEVAQAEADGRAMVHDYQLTTIGNALVSLGYAFNSIKPEELAKAEELLIKVKPHLFAINSDYQPAMRAGRRLDDHVLDQ